MNQTLSSRLQPRPGRLLRTALAASAVAALAACGSAPRFNEADTAFKGRISVTDTPVVLAGKPVTLAGTDFTARLVKLSANKAVLLAALAA